MNFLENTKIPILAKALDAYTLRHKVISSNIANIGTPGYRAKSVEFEDALHSAMSGQQIIGEVTNRSHIEIGIPTVGQSDMINVVDENPGTLNEEDMKSGINDVDIDNEMAQLAKNQIRFKYASRLLSESFRGIQKSIKGTL
ncbi:MAG: flagellar basal body rod protein FlgB [Bacteroidota bacterium]|jgi:flagellar basal-body rod protein FlgB